MKFKVGDRVEILKDDGLCPEVVGKTGTIVDVDTEWMFPYEVDIDDKSDLPFTHPDLFGDNDLRLIGEVQNAPVTVEDKAKNNYLWKFFWDCGRMGELEGLFVATEQEVEDAIGSYVYFGEVLGKHSEIYGTLEKCDVSKVDVSSDAVDELVGHLGYNWSGFNPLDYVRVYTTCGECEETMTEDDWHVEFYGEYDKSLCYECKEKLDAEKLKEGHEDEV